MRKKLVFWSVARVLPFGDEIETFAADCSHSGKMKKNMSKRIWIKLNIEIMNDPKMGQLPDWLWRRDIELFLLAVENGNDDLLQPMTDLAWGLRVSVEKLTESLQALAEVGVVDACASTAGTGGDPVEEEFSAHFGSFFRKRERERWRTLYEAVGFAHLSEIASWAERREIHMLNRGGLNDSLETAAKKWIDNIPKPKGDKTEFFKNLAIATEVKP